MVSRASSVPTETIGMLTLSSLMSPRIIESSKVGQSLFQNLPPYFITICPVCHNTTRVWRSLVYLYIDPGWLQIRMGISADFDPAPGSESHQSGSRFTPVPCEPEIPMHIRTSLISESEYIEPWDLDKNSSLPPRVFAMWLFVSPRSKFSHSSSEGSYTI